MPRPSQRAGWKSDKVFVRLVNSATDSRMVDAEVFGGLVAVHGCVDDGKESLHSVTHVASWWKVADLKSKAHARQFAEEFSKECPAALLEEDPKKVVEVCPPWVRRWVGMVNQTKERIDPARFRPAPKPSLSEVMN